MNQHKHKPENRSRNQIYHLCMDTKGKLLTPHFHSSLSFTPFSFPLSPTFPPFLYQSHAFFTFSEQLSHFPLFIQFYMKPGNFYYFSQSRMSLDLDRIL